MDKVNMPRNVKIFSDEELKILNESYDFEIKSNLILVKSKGMKRVIAHDKKEKFSLSSKIATIAISPLAIQNWEYNFKGEYTLLEVQNAINKLIVMYQEPQTNDISRLLRRKITEIKTEN